MSIKRDTPCPWGSGRPALDPNKLTPIEKNWIGYQAYSGKSTPTKLSNRFNLSVSVIKKYKNKVRDGKTFDTKVGRPRKLDEISMKAMNVREQCKVQRSCIFFR